MKDIVTYCPDLDALNAELLQLGLVDEDGNASLPLIRTPIQYSKDGVKSLALCRFVDEAKITDLAKITCLELLGTYDEVFADPDKKAKYTSVYSLDPVVYTDEEGNEVTYTPPEKFGVFA